jgi:hypothetical protein
MKKVESGKWKVENKESNSFDDKLSIFHFPVSVNLICPACGAQAQRETARFCLVCGKLLQEDYEPLDRLRASYRLQGKTFEFRRDKREETLNLFEENKNSVSQMAWACLVYSFVPYLGILFVPLTFLVGAFGIIVARRQPNLGGHRLAAVSFVLSFVVLAVQIFLWWLLYIIPELGRQI